MSKKQITALIKDVIKANGKGDITADKLKAVLKQINSACNVPQANDQSLPIVHRQIPHNPRLGDVYYFPDGMRVFNDLYQPVNKFPCFFKITEETLAAVKAYEEDGDIVTLREFCIPFGGKAPTYNSKTRSPNFGIIGGKVVCVAPHVNLKTGVLEGHSLYEIILGVRVDRYYRVRRYLSKKTGYSTARRKVCGKWKNANWDVWFEAGSGSITTPKLRAYRVCRKKKSINVSYWIVRFPRKLRTFSKEEVETERYKLANIVRI